jgi:hypothetical protein
MGEANAEVGTSDDGVDIGTLLEVPEGQRLEVDDPAQEDPNDDEGGDVSDVPDGEVVRLSTADLDELEG